MRRTLQILAIALAVTFSSCSSVKQILVDNAKRVANTAVDKAVDTTLREKLEPFVTAGTITAEQRDTILEWLRTATKEALAEALDRVDP